MRLRSFGSRRMPSSIFPFRTAGPARRRPPDTPFPGIFLSLLFPELPCARFGLRDDEDPRRVLVEPMDEAGAVGGARPTPSSGGEARSRACRRGARRRDARRGPGGLSRTRISESSKRTERGMSCGTSDSGAAGAAAARRRGSRPRLDLLGRSSRVSFRSTRHAALRRSTPGSSSGRPRAGRQVPQEDAVEALAGVAPVGADRAPGPRRRQVTRRRARARSSGAGPRSRAATATPQSAMSCDVETSRRAPTRAGRPGRTRSSKRRSA